LTAVQTRFHVNMIDGTLLASCIARVGRGQAPARQWALVRVIGAEELCCRADATRYRANQQGSGGIHLHDAADDMLTLVRGTRGAI